MAEVRVRLPLGALRFGVWESLAIPPAPEAGDRWFKSNCADSHCGGARVGTGRRLLSAPAQVRFLSPQLKQISVAGSSNGRTRRFERHDVDSIPTPAALTEGQANWRWQLSRKQPSVKPPCEFDSHSFR
jgi:hypothetical protein